MKGQKILYKAIRHCQHKRKQPLKPTNQWKSTLARRDKKTNCETHFTLKIHKARKTSSNFYYTHPCEVNLYWDHNHSIHSAHALSFKPISDETRDKFYSYFKQGHSPSSAKHLHELNLAIEYENQGTELEKVRADRSTNPSAQDVYYLYRKWNEEHHGKDNGEDMFKKLEDVIARYNEEHAAEGGRAFMQRYTYQPDGGILGNLDGTEQPLVVAVCTPLMARAHRLVRQAGELVYCDSTSSLDRYNSPTFIMSTCTAAGGIPLGVVITSGESEETITEAFSYLRMVLPPDAFYGRGIKGPENCITDDCSAERNALRSTWPDMSLLLCIFHYLQCWWSWLWDSKQGISKEDRQPIINLVKRMVYTTSEDNLSNRYEALMKDSEDGYVHKYPHLGHRLQQFWERRSEWALSYRVDRMMRGNHTNNYAEAGIRILKEIVFGRIKAYNLIQMFEFITNTMEKYFINRYLDMAHSRYRPGIPLRFKDLYDTDVQNSIVAVQELRDSIYCVTEVQSGAGEVEFTLDMDIGVCSCAKGWNGNACKHQAAVAKKHKICSVNMPPFHSKEARRLFAILARGEENAMTADFYADLRDTCTPSNCSPEASNQSKWRPPETTNADNLQQHSCDSLQNDQDFVDNLTCDPWNERIKSFRPALEDIINDLMLRVGKGDHNMIAGLSKFVKTYKKLQSGPTAAISNALHNFGKSDSKFTICVFITMFI